MNNFVASFPGIPAEQSLKSAPCWAPYPGHLISSCYYENFAIIDIRTKQKVREWKVSHYELPPNLTQ